MPLTTQQTPLKQLQKALAEGVSINDITPLIYAGYSTTSGIIKIAAPFKYVSKVFSYPPKNSGAKSAPFTHSIVILVNAY